MQGRIPKPTPSPHLVPFDGSFRLADADPAPPADAPGHKDSRRKLDKVRRRLRELQRRLYAHNHYSVLLVFQAMDAAGKDGTIRAVMEGINPQGCQVYSFKAPSAEELQHDFLWRTTTRLPERGRIGIFNRSYYEEVLVVRVHPAFLEKQNLPVPAEGPDLWRQRFESIREHEQHLACNGTVIRKFWLNVSRDEQKRRFLARLDEPEKNWKFAAGDVTERRHWDAYMAAYEEALRETSRPWAPWYAVPADDKPYMRLTVARVLAETLAGLDLRYPAVGEQDQARFEALRAELETED